MPPPVMVRLLSRPAASHPLVSVTPPGRWTYVGWLPFSLRLVTRRRRSW
jgi:hypothetical protein